MENKHWNVPNPTEGSDLYRIHVFCDIVHALNCENICHKMDIKKYLLGQKVPKNYEVSMMVRMLKNQIK